MVLADGRTVQLPAFSRLPAGSPALLEATRRGIEIGSDGRIHGIVKVHHWCGNDEVKRHLARVDVSEVLIYLGEGPPTTPPIDEQRTLLLADERFTEHGWDVGGFHRFKTWRKSRNGDGR